MKKIIRILMLCSLMITMTGCGNTKPVESTSTVKESTGNNEDNSALTMEKLNESGELTSITEIKFYGEDEEQPYWNSYTHSLAKSDNGYYFAGYGKMGDTTMFLGHIDKDGKQCVPLCSNAQCTHETYNCAAVFGNYEAQIWTYRDKLYAIKRDAGKSLLVQIDKDGANRKELFEVGKVPADNRSSTILTFSDNYVYAYDRATSLIMGKEYETVIRKRSLDGKEDEVIITSKAINSGFNHGMCYGGNFFFTYNIQHIKNDGSIALESTGLYCYASHTDKVYRVLNKDVSDYAIDVNKKILYYFVAQEGLYEMDMNTGDSKLIYEADEYNKICYIAYDGEYICLDNNWYVYYLGTYNKDLHKVTVLDKDGSKLNEFSVENSTVLFGDSDMLFIINGAVFNHEIGVRGEGQYALLGAGYINKSQIGIVNAFSNSVWP